jgi:hypothetical protein
VENSLQSGLFDFKDKDVKVLCSKQVFERGLGYFRQGRVSSAQVHGLTLRGEVEGSETGNYKVKIESEKEGELIPKCTCPFDMEQFCKHSIALLLHWIDPPLSALMGLNMVVETNEGKAYSFAEIHKMLSKTGFNRIGKRQIAGSPGHIIIGHKQSKKE